MPLPNSAPLSLQVNSNAIQSKPKRAMIVRMSAETLDALAQAHPPMSFDFGEIPGIYIGETFFPMRPQKESSPHELYLRAACVAKPNAPLKLYANVIGKFMVERQLGDKVADKVRQQTMVAKQQYMERQTILLDQPPLQAHGTKIGKRKTPGSGTVLKKTPASDQPRITSPSTLASRKVSPLPQSTLPTKASSDVRRRLVHYLAVAPRHAEDVVKMVGGNITDSAQKHLLALLEDVAEQPPTKKGDTSPRLWSLKPQTWTEVRPYEWPKLTEQDRVAMARQARMAFKALKIRESDPAWENVRYRPTAPSIPPSAPAPPPMAISNSSRSSTSAQVDTKRSAITSKDAKSKAKQDTSRSKGEIQMKNESAKATISRVNAIKRAEVERPPSPSDPTGAKAAASRRLPGSGYQKKPTQLPTGAAEKSHVSVDPRPPPKPPLAASLPPKPSPAASPAGTSHARKTLPTMPPKPTKKEDESDRERDKEHERQREREREKREREKEKQQEERERERVEMEKREKARQKERDAVEREKRQREKEREREEMEQERRQREKERLSKERTAGGAVASFQRRTATQIADDTLDDASYKAPAPKRRKLDDGASVASPSTARDTGLTGSKKLMHEPSPVPRLKINKDRPSPQPSPSNQERQATPSVGGSTHKSERPSKASGSVKSRRRSPIYTSSEDEGEIPQLRKRNASPPPVSDRSNSSDQPPMERAAQRHHRAPRVAYPLANDHAALRALYQSQYSTYLGTFSKIVAQKRKIEAMLNGDSDAELDMMDPDDLVKLTTEHRSLKTELEHIHDIYTKGMTAAGASGGSGSTSDQGV